MNSKEKRKLYRRSCKDRNIFFTYDTEVEAAAYIKDCVDKHGESCMIKGYYYCSVCDCYHLYYKNDWLTPEEQAIVYNQPKRNISYRFKRTVRKRLGRYANIRVFPKQKRMFGTIPDDGRFYTIVSDRYICFNCRKSWRRFATRRQRVEQKFVQPMSVCPHCSEQLQMVYPMFRAPKRTDVKAWEKLRKSYSK